MDELQKGESSASSEIEKINEVLNQTIRPSLQMDGGDLKLISYDNNVLKIRYQGACGSCPNAMFGTLQAIEGVLKERYNPNIVVQPAE